LNVFVHGSAVVSERSIAQDLVAADEIACRGSRAARVTARGADLVDGGPTERWARYSDRWREEATPENVIGSCAMYVERRSSPVRLFFWLGGALAT